MVLQKFFFIFLLAEVCGFFFSLIPSTMLSGHLILINNTRPKNFLFQRDLACTFLCETRLVLGHCCLLYSILECSLCSMMISRYSSIKSLKKSIDSFRWLTRSLTPLLSVREEYFLLYMPLLHNQLVKDSSYEKQGSKEQKESVIVIFCQGKAVNYSDNF